MNELHSDSLGELSQDKTVIKCLVKMMLGAGGGGWGETGLMIM